MLNIVNVYDPSPLTPSDIFPDRCWFDEILGLMLGEGRTTWSTRQLKIFIFLVLAISVYIITVPRVEQWVTIPRTRDMYIRRRRVPIAEIGPADDSARQSGS